MGISSAAAIGYLRGRWYHPASIGAESVAVIELLKISVTSGLDWNNVLEVAIAIGVIALMAGVPVLMMVPTSILLWVGGIAFLTGVVVGIPAGVVYHIRLYQCLKPRGKLDPHWIWHPLRLHGELLPSERLRVLGWGYVGGVGFVLLMAGIIVFAMGIFRMQAGN